MTTAFPSSLAATPRHAVPPLSAAGAPSRANPSQLDRPAYLMNLPFSLSGVQDGTGTDGGADDRGPVDHERAMVQFLDVYNFIAAEAVVLLLPTPRASSLRNLVYTAHLGIVPAHLAEHDLVILSNFASAARHGETAVGEAYFRAMGYRTVVCPHHFEGEAQLKHLHDGVYVGGHGQRTDLEAYRWMERTLDMTVVPLRMADRCLQHLDRGVFPLTRERTMVCTALFELAELRVLEQHTEIVDVGIEEARAGITNTVRIGNILMNATRIRDLRAADPDYSRELAKNRVLEDIAADDAFEVAYFDLSEFPENGALLSGLIMHLNRFSYAFRLL